MIYYINASELAAASGLNPYKTRADLVAKTKRPIVDEVAEYVSVNADTLPMIQEQLNSILPPTQQCSNTSPEMIVSQIKNVIAKDTATLVLDNTATTSATNLAGLTGLTGLTGHTGQANETLVKLISKETTLAVGTESECKDLNRTFGNALQVDTTIKYGYFTLKSNRRVKIGGKIDGLVNGEIIEAKHRKNRLFGRVPLYEQVQCECYMRITKTDVCTHVESYNDKSNVTQLQRNDELWEKVLEGLELYVDLLELL